VVEPERRATTTRELQEDKVGEILASIDGERRATIITDGKHRAVVAS
jgi:hypothetical protein